MRAGREPTRRGSQCSLDDQADCGDDADGMPSRATMFRARRILMATMLSAGAAVPSVAAPAPCPARAALEGNPAVTAPIARGLRAHGVALATEDTCGGRTVRAVVSPAAPAPGYKLHIDAGFGRVSDRVVAEADTAVSLIESWVVEEDADLLAVTPPRATPGPVVAATNPRPAGRRAVLPFRRTRHDAGLRQLGLGRRGSRSVRASRRLLCRGANEPRPRSEPLRRERRRRRAPNGRRSPRDGGAPRRARTVAADAVRGRRRGLAEDDGPPGRCDDRGRVGGHLRISSGRLRAHGVGPFAARGFGPRRRGELRAGRAPGRLRRLDVDRAVVPGGTEDQFSGRARLRRDPMRSELWWP